MQGAERLIRDLARRMNPDPPASWLLHLPGCSNLANRPPLPLAHLTREWVGINGNAVYEFLRTEDARDPYSQ